MKMLEAMAREELRRFDSSLIHGKPRPVPIEDMAERQYGLIVEFHYLRRNNAILGCTIFQETQLPVWNDEDQCYDVLSVKRGTVVISAALLKRGLEGRLRFTVAHELGHWLAHRELFAKAGTAAAHTALTSMEADPVLEREADLLATSLLMPASQVKRAFYAMQGHADPAGSLATLFGVSYQAMSIFLRDHNLE
jgi:Zn-dependent protease with chaperone function